MQAPIATRHSLLSRLKDWEDAESWRQFFETYWRLIYAFALKCGLTETEAQEVVQETTISIADNIRRCRYNRDRGTFKNWLMQITRCRIADQLRKRDRAFATHARRDSNADTATIDGVPDPKSLNVDQQWERDWQENIIAAALDRLRASVPVKQFQAFDLFVTRKWPAAKVAETVGMSVAHVYLAKLRLMRRLKAEVTRLEREVV